MFGFLKICIVKVKHLRCPFKIPLLSHLIFFFIIVAVIII